MSTVTDLNCRICLAQCLDCDKNFKDFSVVLGNLIKFGFLEDVVPQKICKNCADTVQNIQKFIKTCKKTEKILQKSKKLKEIKTEDEFPVKIEAASPSKDVIPGQTVKKNRKICEFCGKDVHISYLKEHLHTHSTQESKKNHFICEFCGYTCATKSTIRVHIRQKHLKTINYKCKYCPQSYSTISSLRFHTMTKHTQKFSHYCETCGKGFVSAYRLATHFAMHLDVRQFACDICGESFKCAQYLGYHKREVHSEKTVPCDKCSKTFKCMKLLRQHRKFHEPNSFKCVLCPQSYAVGQTLRSHLKRNHPELPIAPPGSNLRNISSIDSYLLLCNEKK